MEGSMNYTLGLTTTSFLSGLRGAMAGLAGLTGVALGVGAVVRVVWKAIEEGGALQDLSARTGESVASLYQLRAAFTDVGASAEAIPTLLLRLQRALGGADESGQSTVETLRKLGIVQGGLTDSRRLQEVGNVGLKINLSDFKALDASKQIEILAGSLSKLDKNTSADLAGKLFGRGFGEIKAVVNDFEGFQQVLRETSEEAKMVARSAAAFDRIGDTLANVRRRIGLVFTGIAEGIAPALQAVLNMVKTIDFSGIGTGFAKVISTMVSAIQAGRFGELISLSIMAGLETSLRAFIAFAGLIPQILITALSSPAIGKSLMVGLGSVGNAAMETAGGLKDSVVAFAKYRAQVWREKRPGAVQSGNTYWDILEEEGRKGGKASGDRRSMLPGYASGIEDDWKELSNKLKKLGAQFGSDLLNSTNNSSVKKFAEVINELGKISLPAVAPAGAQKPGAAPVMPPLKSESPDALTRIGFFSASAAGGVDHARNTARNTSALVDLSRKMLESLKKSEKKTDGNPDLAHS